tara:strand:+ start:1358 stop:1525 length:168 start_codon:yes stop_codon:yes gene_type:complete
MDKQIQTEIPFSFEKEEWEKHGFKSRDEWLKACAFDREFKFMKRTQENREKQEDK